MLVCAMRSVLMWQVIALDVSANFDGLDVGLRRILSYQRMCSTQSIWRRTRSCSAEDPHARCDVLAFAAMMSRALILALLACLLALPAQAQARMRDLDDVPNPRQTHWGWVTDETKLLGAAADSIERRLEALHKETGAEVAWVVLRTIGEHDPHQFATNLLQHWGVGGKDEDDGVLVLHVLDRRRIEIVTGYGAEAALPDAKCSWLLQEVAVPAFRADEIPRGHVALSRGIDRALRAPDITHADLIAATQVPDSELGPLPARPEKKLRLQLSMPSRSSQCWTALLLGVFAFAATFFRVRLITRLGLDHLGLIDFFAIMGLFAGLLLSVIGSFKGTIGLLPGIGIFAFCAAASSVRGLRGRRTLRERLAPRPCTRCPRQLRWLEGDEAVGLLSAGARLEHNLKSMRFEVRRCDCGEVSIEGHELPSEIARCPGCNFLTLAEVQRVTRKAATESETGEAEIIRECAQCFHEQRDVVEVPRVSITSTSSDSRSSSSSSSSSGSSSSSSSSSFGGGSSGGGGAGASY